MNSAAPADNATGAIGVLGGTFDPPHTGHLLLGECARAQFGLSRVLFLPAGDPYRKAARQPSPAAHRLEMTRLAIASNDRFVLDDREVRRSGPSYTVDTLQDLRAEGHGELVIILGIDAFGDMPNWKTPARIPDLARVVIALKGRDAGEVAALARAAGLAQTPAVVDMPPLAISSTAIRERLAAGKPCRYLVPDGVLAYASAHALYAPAGGYAVRRV